MWHRIIIIIICIVAFLSAAAQEWMKDAEPALLEVHYTRIAITDTTQRETHYFRDPIILRIGASKSLFCGEKRLWKDSLAAVNPSLEFEVYKATMEENKKTGTHNLPGGHYWSYIYKNYPEGHLTERNYFDGEHRIYEEVWEKPQWQITDSVKTVLGYDCFKAVADYRGRKWTAWFAPEIPVQDGPWKLCGLPGLILEAYDTNKEYFFTATGLRQNGIADVGYMAYDDKRGVKKQTRDKYFNDWWRYKNSNFAAKMNALYGNGKMPEKKDSAP